jgi:urease accessory protein UreE
VFKPTEEQQRPLAPEPGATGDAHDSHGHHH